MEPDPLDLAVRENVTWCDLVCRSHRLTPETDGRAWWSSRRAPTGYPDAITVSADATELDVLGRIHDAPGASVKDSFASLDLEPQGFRVLLDATWIARPPAGGAPGAPLRMEPVTDKYTFTAWRRAWGGPDDVLLPGLLRTAGVTVLGGRHGSGFDRGGILHRTAVHGVEVVGLSNAFGPSADLVVTAELRRPEAWLVGYEHGDALDEALEHGFRDVGPLRVWIRASS